MVLFLRHEDNATKFIVGAYNSLRQKKDKTDITYQKRLLKAF